MSRVDLSLGWCVDLGWRRNRNQTTPAFPDAPLSIREFGATLPNRCLDRDTRPTRESPAVKRKRRIAAGQQVML